MTPENKKPLVKFTKEQLDLILPSLKAYLGDEFDFEFSSLQTQFLLDYITDKLGKYYYNQGVEDSINFMSQKVEDLYLLMRIRED